MTNALYRSSPLEAFISDVAARSEMKHVLGDYEVARLASQRPPVIWRHPRDRYVLELEPVSDHRAEIDVFGQVKETLEMIVQGSDYAAALFALLKIWRTAFDAPSIERGGVDYLASIDYGKARVARPNEVFPKGVPSGSVVLIDLVTITWLAPAQPEQFETVESTAVTAKMYDGASLQGTVEVPTP